MPRIRVGKSSAVYVMTVPQTPIRPKLDSSPKTHSEALSVARAHGMIVTMKIRLPVSIARKRLHRSAIHPIR